MKIKNTLKVCPYTETPGKAFLVLGTTWSVRVYPALLVFFNLETKEERAIPIALPAPAESFLVQQNIKMQKLEVMVKGQGFYLRYAILTEENAIFCKVLRGESKAFDWKIPLEQKVYEPKESSLLSLGCYKKQELASLHHRRDLKELLPIWWQIALSLQGPSDAMQPLHQLLDKKLHDEAEGAFLQFFRASFFDGWVPACDPNHWGFPTVSSSPLSFLQGGFKFLRRLWIEESQEGIYLLPHLLPSLHCGRLTGLRCEVGELNIEWTKKKIRRCIFRCTKSVNLSFHFSKVKTCRLRTSAREKQGQEFISGQKMAWEEGQTYFLDNFKH